MKDRANMDVSSKQRVYALIAGFILVVVNLVAWAEIAQGNVLRVTFFSVGQGDSILTSVTQLTLYSYSA